MEKLFTVTEANDLFRLIRSKIKLPDTATRFELHMGVDEIPRIKCEFFAEKAESQESK